MTKKSAVPNPKPPDEVRSPVRLAHLVRVAHHGFYRGMLYRLADNGVPVSHWMILRMLWQSGRMTQREMSERSGLRESTIFAALKSMEAERLIERRVNPSNRREVHISLTRRGKDLEKPLLPLAHEMNELAIRGLDQATVRTVWRALETIIANFAADEAERERQSRAAQSARRSAGRSAAKPAAQRKRATLSA